MCLVGAKKETQNQLKSLLSVENISQNDLLAQNNRIIQGLNNDFRNELFRDVK